MTGVRWIWIVFIAVLLAFDCSAGNDALTVVEGTVIDATTKAPVRKAHVILEVVEGRKKSALMATTDEMGQFRFADIEEGRYVLTAEKGGFLPSTYGANRPAGEGSILKVGSGEKMPSLTLRLFAAGSLSGHVLDADGDPVADRTVTIFTRVHGNFRTPKGYSDTADTNRVGEYHFDGLAPGTYYLSASGAGNADMSQQPATVDSSGRVTKMRDLETFYPSTASPDEAQGVRVENGQEQAGIDIRVQSGRILSLKGRIVGGNAAAKYSLNASSTVGTGAAFDTAKILANGEFLFTNLRPGTHHLTLVNNGGNGSQVIGETEVALIDQDIAGFVITPFKPAELRVRVVVEGEEDKPLTAGAVFVARVGPEGDGHGFASSQPQNGIFEVDDVVPGKYRLWFSAAGKTYLKAVQTGGRTLDSQIVDVPEGSEMDLVLLFSKSVAAVAGDVEEPQEKNDDPLRAVLVPEGLLIDGFVGMWDRAIHWETLDQSRHFLDENVRPGKYLAFGVQEPDYELWSNAEFVKAVRAEGTELEAGERAHGNVHLKVIPKEEIEEIRKRLGL